MALVTATDYVKEVRRLLQDSVTPYRYSNDNIISALNMGFLEARRLRPDLFLGVASLRDEIPDFTTTVGGGFSSGFSSGFSVGTNPGTVPMDPQYRPALVYYVCGQVQLMDSENTQDARATIFMNKFISQLLQIAA
jgi:hypothetical protein